MPVVFQKSNQNHGIKVYQDKRIAMAVVVKHTILDNLMSRIGPSRITQTILTNRYQQSTGYKYPKYQDVIKNHTIDIIRIATKQPHSMRPRPFPFPIPLPPMPSPTPAPTPVPIPIPIPIPVPVRDGTPAPRHATNILQRLGVDAIAFENFLKVSKIKVCTGANRRIIIDSVKNGVDVSQVTPAIVKAIAGFTKRNLIFINRDKAATLYHAIVDKKNAADTDLIWVGDDDKAVISINMEQMTLANATRRVVVDWGYRDDVELLKATPSAVIKAIGSKS